MEPLIAALYDRLELQRERIERCMRRISGDAVWKRPREGVNSIGNLCLHLAGNESHYIGRGIGGADYLRDRHGEFEASGGAGARELVEKLAEARRTTRRVLEDIAASDLDRPVDVDYPPSPTALGVLLHVVEHYAYHTGQIVLLTRILQPGGDRVLEWGH